MNPLPVLLRTPDRRVQAGVLRGRIAASGAALALGLAALSPIAASARIHVVASTTDLGSIASVVGGDHVDVVAINRPNADPHHVEVLPSYMVRVSRAKVYLKIGLGLDQWADQIIDGSHNGDVMIVDCSRGIEALHKPTGRVDASMGDVHPNGNPHYWLDPRNGGIVARTVAEALGRVDPAHADQYADAADAFASRCASEQTRAHDVVDGMATRNIVTYHESWTYLASAFGLTVVGTVEPVPGIPPTAKHLSELVTVVRQQNVPLLLAEPYFSDDAGRFLNRETGLEVAKVSPSCDDVTPESYLAHFDAILDILSGLRMSVN